MKDLINQWHLRKTVVSGNKEREIQSFTSTIVPQSDNGWRIWYSWYITVEKTCGFGYIDVSPDFQVIRDTPMRITRKPEKQGLNILGVPAHWNLVHPVYLKLPDGRERLYFWAHGSEGICRYMVADSSDGINFTVEDWRRPCLYHPNDRGISRQSLKHHNLTIYCHATHMPQDPSEPEASEDMLMNDATNVYLMSDGNFELYSAEVIALPENAPEPHQKDPIIRLIQRRTSDDGIHWSSPQRILIRDEKDPFDLQFYYLSVTYTQKGRIGILGYYRSDSGTMDMEFCYSQDGVHWERERKAGFPRLKGVESVYAPHDMVKVNDQYYLFYTGYNHTHHKVVSLDAEPDMPGSWIGIATIPVKVFEC